jgi:hypothetical protein
MVVNVTLRVRTIVLASFFSPSNKDLGLAGGIWGPEREVALVTFAGPSGLVQRLWSPGSLREGHSTTAQIMASVMLVT